MKQIIICCLTLTTVLGGHLNHIYAPNYHYGTPNLIDLGEHLDLSHHHLDHEYPSGIILGYGYISGLHNHHPEEQNFHGVQHGINPVSASLTHSFEKSLVAPELPRLNPHITTSIATSYQPQSTPQFSLPPKISTPIISPKFTSTPTQTYEVREENFEPKPIPRLSQLPQGPPTQIGSGSLGVVSYGNGNYAIGSGSLGYGAQASSSGTGGFTPILGPLNYGGASATGSLSSIGALNYGTAALSYGAGSLSGGSGGSTLGHSFGSLGYGGGQGVTALSSSGTSGLSSLGSSGASSLGSSSGFSSFGSGSSGSGQIVSLNLNSLQGSGGSGGLSLFKPQ